MTARFSAGLRNYVAQNGSYRNAMMGGTLKIYSGVQPATAELAPSGVLLVTITDTSGAHTSEVRARGSVTLTGGASGSVDAITVNGVSILPAAVPFNTSLTQTAADVVTAINDNQSIPEYVASSSGAVITLTAMYGLGTAANGYVVATTVTTITKTDVNMGTTTAGVDSVNGLKLASVAAGVLSKATGQTWSGVASATGTAGWFRFTSAVADSGALDSTSTQVRIDGAVSTSGQQLNMSSTSITSAATQTISAFDITLPTS